jgi:hypothetical protein
MIKAIMLSCPTVHDLMQELSKVPPAFRVKIQADDPFPEFVSELWVDEMHVDRVTEQIIPVVVLG